MKHSLAFVALAASALLLTACDSPPKTTVVAKLPGGCTVYEIDRGFLNDTVYVTTCPSGRAKASWENVQPAGKTVIVTDKASETVVQ